MDSLFATVLGLPMHPLVVHVAVVLLPLSAGCLVASFLVPWWRRRYAGLSLVGLTIALGFTWVAKESGEWLGHQVGTPTQHEEWAEVLLPVAAVCWALALIWYVLQRRADGRGTGPADSAPGGAPEGRREAGSWGGVAATAAGALMSLAAAASLVLVALVGHSGAEATWSGGLSGSNGGAPQAAAQAATASYSLTQVREHASTTSCWAAIGSSVYDLTSWIGQHPGGAPAITGLCGTDATAAFAAQHGKDKAPQQRLAGFRIGALSG